MVVITIFRLWIMQKRIAYLFWGFVRWRGRRTEAVAISATFLSSHGPPFQPSPWIITMASTGTFFRGRCKIKEGAKVEKKKKEKGKTYYFLSLPPKKVLLFPGLLCWNCVLSLAHAQNVFQQNKLKMAGFTTVELLRWSTLWHQYDCHTKSLFTK